MSQLALRPTVATIALTLALAAAPAAAADEAAPPVDPALFQGLHWRNIGPYRGGRATAVAGVRHEPGTFYFGAAGGGVWKTTDGGLRWNNVSDGSFHTASVGAIAVAPSDPNVVYAGMGEAAVRGVTTSHGDGVYRSTDAGASWSHVGLEATRHIAAVVVDPRDPLRVYVAAQGSPWKPTPERGIYRSLDGGASWELVLHVDDETGASDLAIDAANPRILYAAFWQHRRTPWKITSGGPGSGIYKSSDGGDSWEELSKGLPELMGKIGVVVSPARPERLWAIVEADDGGLFRSDDGGKSWKRVNGDRELRARAWYYTRVVADPRDAETVYVINAPLLVSTDGGATFRRLTTPHGDQHALWIHPDEPQRMINGNDGGANVSTNGGLSWTTQDNQPTGQFYRVATDRAFPYRVYGGQQDNSTVAILSRSEERGIGRTDWYPVGGCESAWVAFDPDAPRLVYAGCYQGQISEFDVATKQSRNVMAYPYLGLGEDPKDLRYRFNWNAPIVVSPHDPTLLYHAGNVLLASRDRGMSWQELSGDLTRDEEEKQGAGGGPITNEAAGGETYCTIFYVVESPHEPGVIWTGSDDGLVHRTADGGASWQDVTPPKLGEAQVNAIELSPHDPAKAYLAVTRYKLGDLTPYVYRTADNGATWERRTDGIADDAFVRVVREDPVRPGLLYAGTEGGAYISFDDGRRWQPLELDLPVVPVTDLEVHGDDLVASTQGRGFWILDDLAPLRQVDEARASGGLFLFQPADAYRVATDPRDPPPGLGKNPPGGAILDYLLPQDLEGNAAKGDQDADDAAPPPELTLEILDADGAVLRTFSSHRPEEPEEKPEIDPTTLGYAKPAPLPAKKGMNRFVWDLRREDVTRVPELFVFPGAKTFRVPPGSYQARLRLGDEVRTRTFELLADPRTDIPPAAFAEQQRLIGDIWGEVDGLHRSVVRLRAVREQVEELVERTAHLPAAAEIAAAGHTLSEHLTAWEERLVQPRQKTFQDVINFPNRLNAQLLSLLDTIDESDPPVTEGMRHRAADLAAEWREAQAEMERLLDQDVAAFNSLFADHAVPAVIVPPEG